MAKTVTKQSKKKTDSKNAKFILVCSALKRCSFPNEKQILSIKYKFTSNIIAVAVSFRMLFSI